MSEKIEIKNATITDIPTILYFIRQIADYEKLSHEVVATEASLKNVFFGENPNVYCILSYFNNEPVGFAIYFYNFSSFLGRSGMYLEDLFVNPEFRGKGIGKKMFVHLAKLAVEKNCGRLEWSVLDWNQPAIDFYKSLGAKAMDEWTVYRLTGNALHQLGKGV